VALAYVAWGLLPLYWKLLAGVSPVELIAHRVVWTVAVCLIALLASGGFTLPAGSPPLRRLLLPYLASGVLLSANWLIYVYAVSAGRVVEASMGYFMNPLLSVLLAVAALRERLRPAQIVAGVLALAGVLVLAIRYGKVPWVALGLASTFALYGLVKKRSPLEALQGLSLETVLLLPFALAWIAVAASRGELAFASGGAGRSLLLVAAGPVTAVPLLWFAAGARRIPLARVGFLQYLTPTLQLLLGVVVFREPFSGAHALSFALIWSGVLTFLASGIRGARIRGARKGHQ